MGWWLRCWMATDTLYECPMNLCTISNTGVDHEFGTTCGSVGVSLVFLSCSESSCANSYLQNSSQSSRSSESTSPQDRSRTLVWSSNSLRASQLWILLPPIVAQLTQLRSGSTSLLPLWQPPISDSVPSSSETAPTSISRSVAKDTAVNALKLLLKIASDIPGPGVKPALSGLLTIIERVQVRWRNI